MMVNPNKRKLELLKIIQPWLIPGEIEGQPSTLAEDAPDEIKKLYEEWLNM